MNVLESFSLEGKIALVSGGAGHYGRQIVEAISKRSRREHEWNPVTVSRHGVARIDRSWSGPVL